jgi:hypothetical protein
MRRKTLMDRMIKNLMPSTTAAVLLTSASAAFKSVRRTACLARLH